MGYEIASVRDVGPACGRRMRDEEGEMNVEGKNKEAAVRYKLGVNGLYFYRLPR